MSMWCTCRGGRQAGYVAIPVDNLLWVHGECHKPTRTVFYKVTMNRAPVNAVTLLSVYGKLRGVNELTFATKSGERKTILTVQPYDRRPHSMGINPNDILLKTWEQLDAAIKSIKETNHALDMTYQKARARALCDVLAMMMPPFFTTADDVGHEALRRYEHRDNPEYETPGLGVKSLAEFDTPVLTKPSKPKVEVRLDENTQANIKKALESGLFTAAQLAKSYGVSEAVINAIRTA